MGKPTWEEVGTIPGNPTFLTRRTSGINPVLPTGITDQGGNCLKN